MPTYHYGDNSDGSVHESKQSDTQSDKSWGRVSANHHDDGSITDVHVTGSDSNGDKTIISIDTQNSNVGDWYGNFDNDDSK